MQEGDEDKMTNFKMPSALKEVPNITTGLTQENHKPDLLPCPFCGSKNVSADGWSSCDGITGPACDDCGASAGSVRLSTEENIAAWNTRTEQPSPQQTMGGKSAFEQAIDGYIAENIDPGSMPKAGTSGAERLNYNIEAIRTAIQPFFNWAKGLTEIEQQNSFQFRTLDSDGGTLWREVLPSDFARLSDVEDTLAALSAQSNTDVGKVLLFIESEIIEAESLIGDYVDVEDGDEERGPKPNNAMRAQQHLNSAYRAIRSLDLIAAANGKAGE